MRGIRPFILLFALSIVANCSGSEETVFALPPDDSRILYTGRWNFDDRAAPWVAWQGSTVTVRFLGSAVSADLDSGDKAEHYRVIVDGVAEEPYRVLPAGRQTAALAADLDPAVEHTVVLFKETYKSSRTTFYGLTITGEQVLDPPPRPAKRIAFFGDSNMQGYSLYSDKDNGEIGTWFAYPATVSRMLGAEMHLQAVGSATLAGGLGNDVLSFIYSEEFQQPDTHYRSGFKPDVIVINAGANDISRLPAMVQEQNVTQRYKSVVGELRNVYGEEPHIILYNAYSWDLREPANYSHKAAYALGTNVSVLLFPWCWEQWHGDMVDHAGQAVRLARYIVSLRLGFSMQHGPAVVSGYGSGFDFANGSFEGSARDGYGGFGWRYFEDGVERINDPGGAADGAYYIRLGTEESVHQCIDATGDFKPGGTANSQGYTVTASIRSSSANNEAIIGADFEEQALYRRANALQRTFAVTDQWQDYAADFTAPDGTWKVYVSLKSALGDIEFDNVRMQAK